MIRKDSLRKIKKRQEERDSHKRKRKGKGMRKRKKKILMKMKLTWMMERKCSSGQKPAGCTISRFYRR